MKRWFGSALALAVLSCGCAGPAGTQGGGSTDRPGDTDREAATRANLGKLSAEDRKLAEEQKVCPISGKPLGEMGVPVKLTLDGEPVFLCCDGCEQAAKKDEKKTAAKVKGLHEKGKEEAQVRANLAKLSPEDRKIAEQQKLCPVSDEPLGGEMGVPVKVTLDGQTVFLCCKGCERRAKMDEKGTAAKAKELRDKNAAH